VRYFLEDDVGKKSSKKDKKKKKAEKEKEKEKTEKESTAKKPSKMVGLLMHFRIQCKLFSGIVVLNCIQKLLFFMFACQCF